MENNDEEEESEVGAESNEKAETGSMIEMKERWTKRIKQKEKVEGEKGETSRKDGFLFPPTEINIYKG